MSPVDSLSCSFYSIYFLISVTAEGGCGNQHHQASVIRLILVEIILVALFGQRGIKSGVRKCRYI
ncbi:hypothetical protein L211DRAFT_408922 [Terfezia boudieri ATCC MYA-4762]|uniref:Uncharacterized protein n=1 Tax=Terfezia boudieri ATCC MYA-4762 TaxID=1051890 RepID=A0A3N4LK80_9PEZI|nr:hypothetical protein L211DRAFT_408922 [Terfezia boudieri ATCC MYA-4762]